MLGKASPLKIHKSAFAGFCVVASCLLVLCTACNGDETSCELSGDPRDISSYVGESAGFRCLLTCTTHQSQTGLGITRENTLVFVGTGSSWYGSISPGSTGRVQALEDLGGDLRDLIGTGSASPWSVEVDTDDSHSCVNDDHVAIYVSNWDRFDGATAVIGDYLSQNDLQEEIHLTIGKLCN